MYFLTHEKMLGGGWTFLNFSLGIRRNHRKVKTIIDQEGQAHKFRPHYLKTPIKLLKEITMSHLRIPLFPHPWAKLPVTLHNQSQ